MLSKKIPPPLPLKNIIEIVNNECQVLINLGEAINRLCAESDGSEAFGKEIDKMLKLYYEARNNLTHTYPEPNLWKKEIKKRKLKRNYWFTFKRK